jgi:hypothetical protein
MELKLLSFNLPSEVAASTRRAGGGLGPPCVRGHGAARWHGMKEDAQFHAGWHLSRPRPGVAAFDRHGPESEAGGP